MAGGDAGAPPRPVADAFLRFLIPAPKPRPAVSPACLLQPPHLLIAPPAPVPALLRPEERLFIVPPTRPDWLQSPPQPPPARHYRPCPAPGAVARPRPRPPVPPPNASDPRARNAGRFAGGHVNGARGRVPGLVVPRDGGGRSGPQRPKASAQKEEKKKAWVAVHRKAEGAGAGAEDRAVLVEGYSGGDEGGVEADDDLLELESEQDQDDGELRLLLDDQQGDVKSSLPVDVTQECSGCADGDRPSEAREFSKLSTTTVEMQPIHPLMPQSNQAPGLRARMHRLQSECRHDMDTFTSGLLALYESLKPSDEHKSKQKQLVESLAKSVTKEWPNAQIHLYGSCANSFGTSHSDVDVCLEMEIGTESAVDVLLRLADVLRTNNFEGVEAITSARVPIVRMSDPGSGFSCDICINNLLAVANTKLLKDYAQIDQRLLQLAFLVKHWAKQRGVNETYRGTLSSYAYVLMCINFLQLREPAILPCLQAMEPTYTLTVDGTECAYFDRVDELKDFGAENKDSIAELLWGFFHYWASQHHYKNDVISVRLGKTISKQEKNWTTRIGNDRHLMCIEDPFEVGHDLGRVVDRQTTRILREEFERAAAVLQHDDDPCVTLFEPYDYEL